MRTGDFEVWLNHFEHHARHPRRIPHGIPDVLTPVERDLIANSIATFQLGEQSGGHMWLRAAERFAREKQVPQLVRITELMLREQQRHASQLRAFMQHHRIQLRRADWTDRAFRLIRRLAGLEFYMAVLICAELIGNVYYRALESVTDCKRLQILCRNIVCDELAHVGFESQPLFWPRSWMRAHRIFFVCTAVAVWVTHRPVLRKAGHSGRSFLRCCQTQYQFYLEPTRAAPRPSFHNPSMSTADSGWARIARHAPEHN